MAWRVVQIHGDGASRTVLARGVPSTQRDRVHGALAEEFDGKVRLEREEGS